MSSTNSNENNCNQCHEALAWKAGLYHCVSCNQDYNKISFCPDCNAKLQACGATNYFCNTWNSLKSKSRVTHQFSAI